MDPTQIAVVVPTLNEEASLDRCLASLPDGLSETVVSDGGSRDASREVARRHGVRLVRGEAGRGPQLNRGAHATTAPVLLFLHADTTLPVGSAEAICEAIQEGAAGGGFRVRFDDDRLRFRWGSTWVNLRTHLFRAPLGDQGQFVRRELFQELGGFKPWPVLEDLDFIRRLRRRGPIAVLPGPAVTSPRRFLEQGVVRTVATNWLIWILYLGGVSPHRLARLYPARLSETIPSTETSGLTDVAADGR